MERDPTSPEETEPLNQITKCVPACDARVRVHVCGAASRASAEPAGRSISSLATSRRPQPPSSVNATASSPPALPEPPTPRGAPAQPPLVACEPAPPAVMMAN